MWKMQWVWQAAAVLAVAFFPTIGTLGCGFREAAGLALDLEKRYPGSMIETKDMNEGGRRRIEVTIRAGSFGDLNLAEEGREVAEIVRRRYELRPETDTVFVAFRAESRIGVLGTRRSAQFVYPVAELAGE